MPEHLRSLVVILLLASVVFTFAKRPACAIAMSEDDFTRRRNLWFVVTLIAFLAHNFWIYIVATGVLLLMAAPKELNKVALFFFLLFAVPRIPAEITGLGLIKHFFTIDYVRLLSLAILLPAFLALRKHSTLVKEKLGAADKLLIAYIVLNLLLQLTVDTFTNTLRYGFYAFIDVFLPYYVVSRSLKNVTDFRDALMSFVLAGMVLAAIGFFEFSRHWLLYSSVEDALDVKWSFSGYLAREESLRALSSTGHPIALGYVMAVALAFFIFLQKSVQSRTAWILGLGLLIAGLIAPLSRGPWIGVGVMLLIYVATGPKAFSRLSLLGLLAVVALPILLATEYGEKIIDYLPFVGTVDEFNVTYRQRLIEISIEIIKLNPLFGSFDFILYMEELRQGQGIIDIVNSYLNIALTSGLVGLGLFASVFGTILLHLFKGMQSLKDDDELHLLGRVLMATTVGILVIIFTVSSITVIPVVYWSAAGLGLAYVRLLAARSSYGVSAEVVTSATPVGSRLGIVSARQAWPKV